MKGISDEDVFKLMDVFSIVDAACLIAGVSPNQAYYEDNWGEWGIRGSSNDPENASHVFSITLNALTNSIKADKLNAVIVLEHHNTKYLTQSSMSKNWLLTHDIDVKKTTIDRVDLVTWLKQKKVFPDVFFPQGRISDISNTEHKFYCPKLHMLIDAWEALFTADIQSTTIKKYIEEYMNANKSKYRGLADTKESSISSLAEIANFDKGGSTIVGNPLHHFGIEERAEIREVKKQSINAQIYAEIPASNPTVSDADLPF